MFFHSFGDFGDFANRGASRPQEVDNKRLYEVLNIKQNATSNEIKKAYKTLAIKFHPDKGGDPEKFKEINKAYEVLGNPEKRKIYDERGESGLETGGSDPTDVFDFFFKGGSSSRDSGKKRKGENIVTEISLTLEQLYSGCEKKMAISRRTLCSSCNGLGGPENAFIKCSTCDGRGIIVITRAMGPMIQQTQSACSACKGQRKIIAESKKCVPCGGTGVYHEKKLVTIEIEKGCMDGDKIMRRGEANCNPGEVPGDLIFTISQKKHNVFTREKADLYITKEITLSEALTGYEFVITHLDKRTLLVKSNPNEIVQPRQIRGIKDEGMPFKNQSFNRGNLFIKFEVIFPVKPFSMPDQDALRRILPQPPKLRLPSNMAFEEFVPVELAKSEDAAASKSAYDDDDSEEEGHPEVSCKQQ